MASEGVVVEKLEDLVLKERIVGYPNSYLESEEAIRVRPFIARGFSESRCGYLFSAKRIGLLETTDSP